MNTQKISLCISLMALAAASQAVNLVVNTYVALPGSSSPTGTVIEDSMDAFSYGSMFGTVRSRVVRKADNTLAFIWQVNRTDTDRDSRTLRFRMGGFYTSIYDADYSTTSVGTHPVTFGYLHDTAGAVSFAFTENQGSIGGLLHSTSTRFWYLDTDATDYARTAQFDFVGKDANDDWLYSGQYSTFAPVPEPATMVALGLGITVLLRRRKRAA